MKIRIILTLIAMFYLRLGAEEPAQSAAAAPPAAQPPAKEEPVPMGPWTISGLETKLTGNDPIEGFNRSMFSCTTFTMDYIADPVVRGYTTVLPRPAIEKIDNACINLEYPGRVFSCLLRADWGGSGDETSRFFINTTLGVAGIFDVADSWFDIYSTQSDFDQTFAAWGIAPGCTFVLPFLTSTNVRATCAKLFDIAFDGKTYIPFAGTATALNRLTIANESMRMLNGSNDRYETFIYMTAAQRELLQRQWFYRMKNAKRDHKNWLLEPINEQVSAKIEKPANLAGNWVPLKEYYPASPLQDTMRITVFDIQNNYNAWFFRLSAWNHDFAKKSKERTVRLSEQNEKLTYSFWPAPEGTTKEQLLILIPGIGGIHTSETAEAIAETFNSQGYAVLSIDNNFAWSFIKANDYQLPGNLPKDAAATREFLKKILASLRDDKLITHPRVVLSGYSMGAMETLYIADLETKKPELNISRYVAINPPADLLYAMKYADGIGQNQPRPTIDQLVDGAGIMYVYNQKIMPVFDPAAVKPPKEKDDTVSKKDAADPKLANGMAYRLNITEVQAEFFASIYFKLCLRESLSEVHKVRPIPTITVPYRWGNRTSLYRELDAISFERYAKEILSNNNETQFKALCQAGNLRSIENTLKTKPEIRILHNYDDFLLSADDKKFLDQTLGQRITWFDQGGHLGNLYYQNVQTVMLKAAQ